MKLIVAVNNGSYIGKDGKLMWRCKADLQHFKTLTMGGVLIVGATTFTNDLRGKQLPGRKTYVVGKDYMRLSEAVREAVHWQTFIARNSSGCDVDGPQYPTIWVIGGSSIYKQLLPLCDEIHMSVINDDSEGDVKFEVPADYRGKVTKYHFEPEKAQ